MSDIAKIAAVGMIAAIFALVIRKQTPELAILLTICAGAVLLNFCFGSISVIKSYMDELSHYGGISSEVVAPVMKVTGIALVSRFAANFCKDAQEQALATVVETAGSAVALVVVFPLMDSVLKLIGELL